MGPALVAKRVVDASQEEQHHLHALLTRGRAHVDLGNTYMHIGDILYHATLRHHITARHDRSRY